LGVVAVDGVTHRGPLLLIVSYRVTRSVAVGDVPASPLSLRAGCFPLCHPCLLISSVGITDRLTTAVLSDHLLSVVCHDGVEVGCFVHALSIGGNGGIGTPFVPPFQLAHSIRVSPTPERRNALQYLPTQVSSFGIQLG